jgi:uncharacterized protein (DUF2225 family)
MNKHDMYVCGICFHQAMAKDFTPITVSADFNALECPKCLNNDMDSFEMVDTAFNLTAQIQNYHHRQGKAA